VSKIRGTNVAEKGKRKKEKRSTGKRIKEGDNVRKRRRKDEIFRGHAKGGETW